jgi:hypothetical protein
VTECCCGPRSCSTRPILALIRQAAAAVGWPLHSHDVPEPQRLHARAPRADAVQSNGQRRPAQALPRAGRHPTGSGPGVERGAGGRALLLNRLLHNRTEKRGVKLYLVLWPPADDEWLRAEELGHCLEKVAEYDAAAPRRRAARRGDLGTGPAAVGPAAAAECTRAVLWPRQVFGWRSRQRLRVARRWG